MAKLFILTGIVLLLVGLIIFASEREGFTLYLPLATSLVVSLGLTLVLWLLSR